MKRVMQHLNRVAGVIETRTRDVTVTIVEHRCEWCGEFFEATRADARLCPQPKLCRKKQHRAKGGR